MGFYTPKNNPKDWLIERHRVKIPTLGWVRLKEYGYLPVGAKVVSGTIKQQANRYFVSVLVEEAALSANVSFSCGPGKGVDVGLKDFAIVSNGDVYKNINKSSAIKHLEKRLKRTQRALSRKYQHRKKVKSATKRGSNIDKNVLRVQKLQRRLANVRSDYRADVVRMLTKTKPAYITIEDLNVQGMMTNRHLSRSIANQGFYDFMLKLTRACAKLGIELRQVSRFYPSSKWCSRCGHKKGKLSLAERIFTCESCGWVIDRDLNAAINLEQAKDYIILT